MESGMATGSRPSGRSPRYAGLLGGVAKQDRLPLLFQPSVTEFDKNFWAPTLRATVILNEFIGQNWKDIAVPAPLYWSDLETMRNEVTYLINLQPLRPQREAEILDQANNLDGVWRQFLTADSGRRPATGALIDLALKFAHFVGMHWKRHYKAPRPAQVYPALMPIVPTPRHPAYPSGHSLQSHLVRRLLLVALRSPNVPSPLPQVASGLEEPLQFMAERIAANREVAGVHFRTDSVASAELAQKLAVWLDGLLKAQPGEFKELRALISDVRAEWKGADGNAPPNQMDAIPSFADQVANAVAKKIGGP